MNSVNWFEIPTQDLARAQKFYERVFNVKLQEPRESGVKMAMFPGAQEYAGATGALVPSSETAIPSQYGTVVYFGCQNLSQVLQRVEESGGKVLLPKTDKGNRVGLHSMQ